MPGDFNNIPVIAYTDGKEVPIMGLLDMEKIKRMKESYHYFSALEILDTGKGFNISMNDSDDEMSYEEAKELADFILERIKKRDEDGVVEGHR